MFHVLATNASELPAGAFPNKPPKFLPGNTSIDADYNTNAAEGFPNGPWRVSTGTVSNGNWVTNAFDKSPTTQRVSGLNTYPSGVGSEYITIMYPYAVAIKSFTLQNSADLRQFSLQGSVDGVTFVTVEAFTRTMTENVESFTVTATYTLYQHWRLLINGTSGTTVASVGEWELQSYRGGGGVTLAYTQPVSPSAFKLVFVDSEGRSVRARATARPASSSSLSERGRASRASRQTDQSRGRASRASEHGGPADQWLPKAVELYKTAASACAC
ncbi:hypothetical protein T492DRAFT_1122026 [Pavlovales sp. CCMP2436]|nr:hypothetical protein T492DRAFT_1122026 [Pavlovales sp. CCMP2436]